MNFFISTVNNDRFYVNPEKLFTTLLDLEQSVIIDGSKSDRKLLSIFESVVVMANKIVANPHFDLSNHEKLPNSPYAKIVVF
jgi:predicted KAP-like P-loop ATPase